jgi:hypothetical protein
VRDVDERLRCHDGITSSMRPKERASVTASPA